MEEKQMNDEPQILRSQVSSVLLSSEMLLQFSECGRFHFSILRSAKPQNSRIFQTLVADDTLYMMFPVHLIYPFITLLPSSIFTKLYSWLS